MTSCRQIPFSFLDKQTKSLQTYGAHAHIRDMDMSVYANMANIKWGVTQMIMNYNLDIHIKNLIKYNTKLIAK